ncbi:MAG TPA: NAD(P)-binding domain-containing protein, partial [Cyclobacteriaceae bacterium]|nr:NAD(P)-binding domain-containing protein [Cyclobacteriaceae bacterium]
RTFLVGKARELGITSLMTLSTCNRTEIYAENASPGELPELLHQSTKGSHPDFNRYGYIKNSREAVGHLFRVAAGMDSRVSGDSRITSQVKEALTFSIRQSAIGTRLGKLAESAISTGKRIRNYIMPDKASPSVPQSAADMIMEISRQNQDRSIKYLIIGMGNIGREIAESLLQKIPPGNITVISRNIGRLFRLYNKSGLRISPMECLEQEILGADFVFAATSASHKVIRHDHLRNFTGHEKTIIDLGVPRNVCASVTQISGIRLIDIDQVIKGDPNVTAESMTMAEAIIDAGITEFEKWHQRWKHAQDVKYQLYESIFDNNLDDPDQFGESKFIEGLTGNYFRYREKVK